MSAARPSPPVSRIAKYSEIRTQIKDGDLLLLRGDYLLSRVFERATHATYSHATIAMWWGDRLMLLQAEAAGVQAVPLSVAEAFKSAGLPLLDRDAITTWPEDIAFSKLLEYRRTIAHDPSRLPPRLLDFIPPGEV